jgi:hypothetical protein
MQHTLNDFFLVFIISIVFKAQKSRRAIGYNPRETIFGRCEDLAVGQTQKVSILKSSPLKTTAIEKTSLTNNV